jgi:hypothetical protein
VTVGNASFNSVGKIGAVSSAALDIAALPGSRAATGAGRGAVTTLSSVAAVISCNATITSFFPRPEFCRAREPLFLLNYIRNTLL